MHCMALLVRLRESLSLSRPPRLDSTHPMDVFDRPDSGGDIMEANGERRKVLYVPSLLCCYVVQAVVVLTENYHC